MNTIRKNITLSKSQADKIDKFARMKGISVSEFLRDTALKEIEQEENKDLLEFLNDNINYVSDEEQKDYDNLNLEELRNQDFREITIDEIL